MRFAIAFTLMSAVLAPAQPQNAKVEQEIRELERKINAAYGANDLAAYFSYYASDFTQFLPEGRTDLAAYKKDWTAYIGAGNRLEAADTSDMHVQVGPAGDTAIASYVLHVRTRLKDGKVTNEDFQESDVFFKRSGAWKVVHLHYSPAPKKSK